MLILSTEHIKYEIDHQKKKKKSERKNQNPTRKIQKLIYKIIKIKLLLFLDAQEI